MTTIRKLASETAKRLLDDLAFSAPEAFNLHIEKRLQELAYSIYDVGYAEGESSREADFQALYEEGMLEEYLKKHYGQN